MLNYCKLHIYGNFKLTELPFLDEYGYEVLAEKDVISKLGRYKGQLSPYTLISIDYSKEGLEWCLIFYKDIFNQHYKLLSDLDCDVSIDICLIKEEELFDYSIILL